MASITKISLYEIQNIQKNKHQLVWVGVQGGNYDLYTGKKYIPSHVTNNTLGTLLNRDYYYKLFGNLEKRKVIQKKSKYQAIVMYIKILINYILSYIKF